jgi:hypothetical protein
VTIRRHPCRALRGRGRCGMSHVERGGGTRAWWRPSPETGEKAASGPISLRGGGEGDDVRCLEESKGIGGGRGKLSGVLEWDEAVGRGKETEGEEEGGSGGLSSGR